MSAWLPISNLLLIAAMFSPGLAIWRHGKHSLAASAVLARIVLTNDAPLRF